MKVLHVKIRLLEEMLGTSASDPNIHADFIASKAPDAKSREEEIAAIGTDAAVEKAMTIFPKEDGKPFVWNYQIKGFFKAACGFLQRMKGEAVSKESCKLKAYKKVIDGCVFVFPRKIFPVLNGEMGDCQRPLRAQTAQGDRVALANSETIPAGSTLEFKVKVPDSYEKAVREWLLYGECSGLGQWRNSGKGSFEVLSID